MVMHVALEYAVPHLGLTGELKYGGLGQVRSGLLPGGAKVLSLRGLAATTGLCWPPVLAVLYSRCPPHTACSLPPHLLPHPTKLPHVLAYAGRGALYQQHAAIPAGVRPHVRALLRQARRGCGRAGRQSAQSVGASGCGRS